MAQQVIHDHEREHCFRDRHGPDSDAGVVATGRADLDRVTRKIDRAARDDDAGRRLDGHADHEILARGDAAQGAAGMVGQEPLRRQFVAMFRTTLRDAARNLRRSRRP